MFTTLMRRWLRAWAAPAIFSFLAACSGGNNDGDQAIAPTITAQPAAATATEGGPATFTVVATGTAPLAYQWQRNGAAISGATTASYTAPAVALGDNGAQYSVVISNSAGSVTSSSALLTAQAAAPPAIVAQPVAVSIVAPATATFSVTAQGSSLAYQWSRNGTPIGGATSASYTTPATALADSGALFAVTVSNARGNAISDEAELTVTTAAQAPAIATEPAGVTVDSGATASFSVVATGTAPLTYQWRRNGAAITGANAANYTTPATVDGDDGAVYSVVIDNAIAMPVVSAAAILDVIPAITPPSISAQPAAQSVIVGQTATFSVAATGSTPLAYQWRRNGSAIGGATAASYTTPATVIADNGTVFSVVVSNASATQATSAGATLSVTAAVIAASITAQPVDATVGVGQSATFSVSATGTAPLAYQWRRNGAAIAGATAASYTVASATLADHNALFDVVVSNAAGTSATSNTARLSVLDAWLGVREDGSPVSNRADVGRAIATDAAGNVVIAGHTNGALTAPGAVITNSTFVAKYGANGVLRWSRVIVRTGGSTSGLEPDTAGVAVNAAGEIYVTGFTAATLDGQVSQGRDDAFLVKYDGDGNLLWARQFGSSDIDSATGVALDPSGNAFVVGRSKGQMPDQSTVNSNDFYVAKFDASGNRLWIRQSGVTIGAGAASDTAFAIAVDAGGNAYITGSINGSYAGQGDGSTGQDAYVIKYDPAGNRVMFSRIAGKSRDEGYGIAVSADGNTIYVVGRTLNDFDQPGFPSSIACCSWDAFIVNLDGSGAIRWAHNLPPVPATGPEPRDEQAFAVATDAAGSAAYLTGKTNSVMPGETGKGAYDIFVARFAADGARTWVRQFGGVPPTQVSTVNDAGHGIALDRNGDVFVTGEVMASFGTPNPETLRTDWFVMKLRPADGSVY